MRFLPAHPERSVEGDGESLLVFNMRAENVRRVWVTINERTLADSFWPAPKRIGLAEGASRRRLHFEPNIMLAVEGWAFVQENGRERVDVKGDLLGGISAAIPVDTLIATN
jgi:3-hydroxyacyl-CoA dehydrogenase